MTDFKWTDVSEDEEIIYEIDFGPNLIYDSVKLWRRVNLESCDETWEIHTRRIDVNNKSKTDSHRAVTVYEGLEVPEFLRETMIRMVMNRHIATKDDRIHYKSQEISNLQQLTEVVRFLQA